MDDVHLVTGIALLLANLIAGVWGGVLWLGGTATVSERRRRASVGFWYGLRVAQATVVLQAALGLVLVFSGHTASSLHYLYGVLPLVVSLLAELIRAGAAAQELGELDFEILPEPRQHAIALAIIRREMGIMAVACLVIFLLALRAAGTSSAF